MTGPGGMSRYRAVHCPKRRIGEALGSLPPCTNGPSRHRRCRAAKRLTGRVATMDRALIRTDEAFVGCRIGRARRHRSGRRGDDRRDVRFASPHGLEWLGPCGQLGGFASLATGTSFDAATRAAGAPTHTVHHGGAGDLQPCRARRVPSAPPPATPGLTAAVAPRGPRDIPSAGDGASAVDLARRGSHR